MKINPIKLELAIANTGLTMREIQKKSKISNVTFTRARTHPAKLHLSTIGRIAKALGVQVTEIIERGSHENN